MYSAAEFAQLDSGAAQAVAYGEIDWTLINGSWRGRLPVSAVGFHEDEIVLEFVARPKRPSEPTVVVVVRGEHMKRVDVNGGHDGDVFTHIQWRKSPNEAQVTRAVPDWFIDVEFGDNVHEDTYARVFRDAARLLNVDISGVNWTDPPEGGTSS